MTRLVRALAVTFALLLGVQGPGAWTVAHAQPVAEVPDYAEWERTANRAEEAIISSRASTDALETLLKQLWQWRRAFVAAQSINANAIATTQTELAALGPEPEDGVESGSIAVQRQTLKDRLERLREPVRDAELAQNRADGLITGVDRIISKRKTEALLEVTPSPINPANWRAGLAAMRNTSTVVRNEVIEAWKNPVQRKKSRNDLPATAMLLIIGLVLVLRGRNWSRRLSNRVLGEAPGAGRWLAGFVISTGSLFLPFFGLVCLIEAVFATNLVGLRGEQIIEALYGPFLSFLVYRWVGMRIFPARESRSLPLVLSAGERRQGRWIMSTLGLVAGAFFWVAQIADANDWEARASNVIQFPILVAAALLLLHLAFLVRQHNSNTAPEDPADEAFRNTMKKALVLAMAVVSAASPILAAAGYFEMGSWLLFPTLLSVLLLAALLILQRLVVEIYVLLTGNREGATDSLIPVLAGLLLVVAALPLFALAWGVRPVELLQLWTTFKEGANVGGIKISPTVFLTFAVVFSIGYAATRLLQGTLKNTILPKTKLDQGGRNAIVSGVGYLGIFLAAVVAITSAGLDLSSIAIVAGALSVGIGFGLRTIVENFVSGIILLIERPISEGDWIEVGGIHGTVRDISVRSTRIETFDRSDVILPNADLVAGRVTNYTRGNTVGRVIVPVGVAYGLDTRRVEQILLEVAEAHPMVLANPAPYVVFQGFGTSSLDFEIRAILRDVNWVLTVRSDMNHAIAERFAQEGIEIPFAQRDIWLRNPEALTGEPVKEKPSETRAGRVSRVPMPPDDPDPATPPEHADGDAAGDGGER